MMQYSGQPTTRQFVWSGEFVAEFFWSLFVQFRRESSLRNKQPSEATRKSVFIFSSHQHPPGNVFIYASTAVPELLESCCESALKQAQHFEKA
jgi:hypothetical protein